MKHLSKLLAALLLLVFAGGNAYAQTNPAYQHEINAWHAGRIKDLKAGNGWLNLVGLYWLDEGKSTFGSGSQNTVVFPKGSVAETAGYFTRTGSTVKLVVENNTPVKVDGKPAKEAIIFQDTSISAVVTAGSLQWVIIQRDDKIGIRLRDLKSPVPAAFKGVARFAVDAAWRLPAVLQTQPQPQSIDITNIIGQTSSQKSPGKLLFTVDGKAYTLDALEEGDHLFVIFGDATNGKATYPSGRFIEVAKPGTDGKTFIDFNKAYNPPCAFTDFATCPLPPKQNRLAVAITAGEKAYGHHHS